MKPTSLAAIVPIAALLAACGPQTETPSELPADPYGLAGATVLYEGGPELMSALTTRSGITIDMSTDGSFVTIAGTSESRVSGGRTSGAYIEISGDAEQALAGRLIEIVLVARSAEGSALEAAYSTNDVGNSGWIALTLNPSFTTAAFTYRTQPMNAGGNDYLGFIAQNGPVDIAAIAVRPVAEAQ